MIGLINDSAYKTNLDEALAAYKVDMQDPVAIQAFSLGHMIGWINSKNHTFKLLEEIKDNNDGDEPQ